MTREELIETLADYERHGWVVVALPPGVAEMIVGKPATQARALEVMGALRAQGYVPPSIERAAKA